MTVCEHADVQTWRSPCRTCKKQWPYPRNVSYRLVAPMPEHIGPRTPRTVVAHQSAVAKGEPDFSLPVMEQISFTSPYGMYKKALVHEFEYHREQGTVFFDIRKQGGSNIAYARLITLNSWYISLFSAMLFVCLGAMDIQSNLALGFEMMIDENKNYAQFYMSKYLFGLCWFGLVLLNIACAYREALWEWTIKSSALVGDLITECNSIDTVVCFFALVMFKFFFLEMHVKDIVILLHPWKAVQPYAAFKCENARGYLVGFPSEYVFRMENRAGQHLGLPIQMITKATVLAFKLWLAYWSEHRRWALVFSSMTTACSTFWLFVKLYFVLKDRKVCRDELTTMAETGDERQRGMANKLLAQYFRLKFDRDGNPLHENRQSWLARQITGCVECGRGNDDDADMGHEETETVIVPVTSSPSRTDVQAAETALGEDASLRAQAAPDKPSSDGGGHRLLPEVPTEPPEVPMEPLDMQDLRKGSQSSSGSDAADISDEPSNSPSFSSATAVTLGGGGGDAVQSAPSEAAGQDDSGQQPCGAPIPGFIQETTRLADEGARDFG
mmetsp:Transcript_104154/g.269743  ORF Transcript_104154/g.269743 Transcript_104154/m.269743 type:complete len:555 (+) Transcript_104154:108-1772(+)